MKKDEYTFSEIAWLSSTSRSSVKEVVDEFQQQALIAMDVVRLAEKPYRCIECKKPGRDCTDKTKCEKNKRFTSKKLRSSEWKKYMIHYSEESVWALNTLIDQGKVTIETQENE